MQESHIKFSCTVTDLELMFKGSDAVERKGVYYAISDRDHPSTKLLQSPSKISSGMAAQVRLSIRKVHSELYSRMIIL